MPEGALSLPRSPARRGGSALAVLRFRQWVVFAPLPAAGLARLDEVRGARMGELAAAIVAAGLALAYAYGINAIFDRRADEDPRKNVLAGRETVPLAAIASVTGAGLGALLVAGALGGVALGSIAASVAAGTVYSAGPRLKRLPMVGLLANHSIFLPLLFTAVHPSSGPLPGSLWFLSLVFALLLAQNQLLHEEGDAAEDAAASVMTTARWLGARGVRWAVAALAAGIALAGLAAAPVGLWVCLLGAPATAWVGLADHPATLRRRAHRYLAATLGVALFLVSLGVPAFARP